MSGPLFHIDAGGGGDWIKGGPREPRSIEDAMALGWSDERIVQRIVEETAVTEGDAWQILAWARGEDMSNTR